MSEHKPVQLSLDVSLNDEATFTNYFCGANDHLVLRALEQLGDDNAAQNILIWGAEGVGLSHLLQACCHRYQRRAARAQYLPLNQLSNFDAEAIVDGLDECDLVCVDELEYVCGREAWEKHLFHLYNRLKDRGAALIIATHRSPTELTFKLADLGSRVRGSLIYRLQGLDDAEKAQALILRAENRGLNLSMEVAQYIMTRISRNFADIYEVLKLLDMASLQHQRKLTIPFVKRYLV